MTRQKPANPLTLALPPAYARDLAVELHGAAERHTRAVRTAAAELDAQDGDNRAPAVHIARALAVAARLEHIADAIEDPIGLLAAIGAVADEAPDSVRHPLAVEVDLTELLGPTVEAAQPTPGGLGPDATLELIALIPRLLAATGNTTEDLEDALGDLATFADLYGITYATELADDDADPVTDPPTGSRWVDTATGEAVDPPEDDPAAALAELEDVGTP